MHRSTPAPLITGMTAVEVPGAAAPMGVYASRPAGGGPWPSVIVGFELFGLTPYMRAVTDRLAGLGLHAVAPDFYHRTAPGFSAAADAEGRSRGFALLDRLTREEVAADVRAVVSSLEDDEGTVGRPSMAGFSVGGHLAYYAATQLPLAAVALVYPGWLDAAGTALSRPEPLLDLTPGIAADCRLLYLVGADDQVAPPEQTRRVADRLTAAGLRHEVVVYPDTPHGFLADERDTFRPEPAADAWARLAALLAPAEPPAEPPAGAPAA